MILKVTNASSVQSIITKYELTDYSDLFDGWLSDVWLYQGFSEEDNTISFEFRYYKSVEGSVLITDSDGNETKVEASVSLEPLFTSITVPKEVTNEELKALADVEIIVIGHAVQSSGFEGNQNAAWAAFDVQVNPD